MGVIEMKYRVGCVQTRVMVLARSGDSVFPWVMLIPPHIRKSVLDRNFDSGTRVQNIRARVIFCFKMSKIYLKYR